MTDARSIQNPQRAIALRTPLLEVEWVIGGATQRSIRLQSKRGTREAMRKREAREFWRAVSDRRRGCFRKRRLIR